MIVVSTAVIRTDKGFLMPGVREELPDTLAKKLINAGLVTAAIEPEENAMVKGGRKRVSQGHNATCNRAANTGRS